MKAIASLSRSGLFAFCLASASWAGPLDQIMGSDAAQDEFLRPEQAFSVQVEAAPGEVRAHFTVAPGYYLYRERIKISSPDRPEAFVSPDIPPGKAKEDPEFGRIDALVGDFSVRLPQQPTVEPGSTARVELSYQGCAEAGLCYPPIKQGFDLTLTPASSSPGPEGGMAVVASGTGPVAATPAAPDTTGSLPTESQSEADALAARLSNNSLLSILLLFFGFGVLLSFTPCVFPMVPILSGILIGGGRELSAGRGFSIALSYVLAMAGTYALAGVVTALLGGNVQAAMQHPVVLVGFAGVFVVLAFSMFGYWELQMPAALQTRLSGLRGQGGSLQGAALMGALSALIVGPCVAPPLVGALLYIANSGDALLGGLALFVLGLGMGLPLLLLGLSAGHVLPRAGRWMEDVKHLFGVIMLGVAWWLLERLLPGPVMLAGWASLLVLLGVYLGAIDGTYDGESAPARVRRGFGVLALLYGAALLIGAAAGADDPLQPLADLRPTAASAAEDASLVFETVRTSPELQAALSAAKAVGQPVMLDFYADWCVECKRMERTTLRDPGVRQALSGFRLLKADVTDNTPEQRALLNSLDLYGPPATLFYAPPEVVELRRLRLTGFADAERLQAQANAARRP